MLIAVAVAAALIAVAVLVSDHSGSDLSPENEARIKKHEKNTRSRAWME
jgi:hypothetical protein